jgi:hypothetical protein
MCVSFLPWASTHAGNDDDVAGVGTIEQMQIHGKGGYQVSE